MNGKYKIHIPTEQYGFIEIDCDNLVEAKLEYDNAKKIFDGEKVEGMNQLEWAKFRKKFLSENTYSSEEYEQLSPIQRWWVKELQNTFKQIEETA